MKRLLNIAGGLLGLLALGALAVALALTFGGLRRGAEPASQAFQPPIETPTPPPYPPPVTPPPTIPPEPSPPIQPTVTVTLPPYPPPQTPTPRATVTPPVPGTPTAVPTPSVTVIPPGMWRAETMKIARLFELPIPAQARERIEGALFRPVWSVDGDSILVEKETRQFIGSYPIIDLWKLDARGQRATLLANQATLPAWSPDGLQIAYLYQADVNDYELWIMNRDGSNKQQIAVHLSYGRPDWLGTDRLVAVDQGKNVLAFPLDGSAPQLLTEKLVGSGPTMGPVTIALSLDDSYLVVADAFNLWLVNLETPDQPPVRLPPDPLYDLNNIRGGLSWSPDGRKLAYAVGDQVWITYLDDFTTIRTGGGENPNSFAWAPDGSVLAFLADQRMGDIELYVTNGDNGLTAQLTNDELDKVDLAWSPDGHRIIFAQYNRSNLPQIAELAAKNP